MSGNQIRDMPGVFDAAGRLIGFIDLQGREQPLGDGTGDMLKGNNLADLPDPTAARANLGAAAASALEATAATLGTVQTTAVGAAGTAASAAAAAAAASSAAASAAGTATSAASTASSAASAASTATANAAAAASAAAAAAALAATKADVIPASTRTGNYTATDANDGNRSIAWVDAGAAGYVTSAFAVEGNISEISNNSTTHALTMINVVAAAGYSLVIRPGETGGWKYTGGVSRSWLRSYSAPVAATGFAIEASDPTYVIGTVLTAVLPAGAIGSIQWLRDGVNISGATGTTYTIAEADSGALLDFKFTPDHYVAGGITAPVFSNTVPVPPAAPTWTSATYIDAAAGNDTTGTGAIGAPYASMAKIQAMASGALPPGRAILFKKGQTHYGTMRPNSLGNSTNPIVISSYGTGARPILTGMTTLTGWTPVSGQSGVYEATMPSTAPRCRSVTLNGTPVRMGRFPKRAASNGGYAVVASHTGVTAVTDTTLTHPVNWTGGEIVVKPIRYHINPHPITNHVGATTSTSTFTYSGGIAVPFDSVGYFIQNHAQTLTRSGTTVGEWFHDTSTHKLRMYFGGNDPATYVVKAGTIDNVLDLHNLSYYVIDDITIDGANMNGCYVDSTAHITVQNATIKNCGYFGVAGGSSVNLPTVEYVAFNDIGSSAVWFDSAVAPIVKNCTLANIGVIEGASPGGDGQNNGISVTDSDDTYVAGNVLSNIGFNGVSVVFGPAADARDTFLVENNFVSNACVIKDDGAALYTYRNNYGVPSNGVIRKNIVVGVPGTVAGTVSTADGYKPAMGVYLDGFSQYVEISDNVITGAYLAGLWNLTGQHNSILNNVFYLNGSQIALIGWTTEEQTPRYLLIAGNTLVSGPATLAAHVTDWYDGNNSYQPAYLIHSQEEGDSFGNNGVYNNNKVYSPADQNTTFELYDRLSGARRQTLVPMLFWRALSFQDTSSYSNIVTYPGGTVITDVVKLEYNTTIANRTVTLGAGTWVDEEGVALGATFVLPPFSAKLIHRVDSISAGALAVANVAAVPQNLTTLGYIDYAVGHNGDIDTDYVKGYNRYLSRPAMTFGMTPGGSIAGPTLWSWDAGDATQRNGSSTADVSSVEMDRYDATVGTGVPTVFFTVPADTTQRKARIQVATLGSSGHLGTVTVRFRLMDHSAAEVVQTLTVVDGTLTTVLKEATYTAGSAGSLLRITVEATGGPSTAPEIFVGLITYK